MSVASREMANALRILSAEAVQKAGSGHPGMPLGMADIAAVLWREHLRHDPCDPAWPGRDRFVLSNGHGSMLLYALLHLSGYDLPMSELENFRQLGSRTPGHPEFGLTPGVESTTGPLGQGLANAVGMALARRLLAERFDRPGCELFDHRTYVFAGDGCLMEGISHEAASLAGVLGLGGLIVFYDDNGISIDGEVGAWFGDDTAARFRAYGWRVVENVDGHDMDAVRAAIEEAHAESARPCLIACKTVIGFGAPARRGTAAAHGMPLGEEEVAALRAELDWDAAPFSVPESLREAWDMRDEGARRSAEWRRRCEDYRARFPAEGEELARRLRGELPADFDALVQSLIEDAQRQAPAEATRKSSAVCLETYAAALPELFGGSADLSESNNTLWSGSRSIAERPGGNYLHYGVREFAMTAIQNGIALHGGARSYGGTFLVFSDYARNAVRMAALMKLPCVFIYSHDSIGLGEDGPTHQPVEHLPSLRLIPGLEVWRPCDRVEVAAAWGEALKSSASPTALVLSRQSLAAQPRDAAQLRDIARGAYVLFEPEASPRAMIIATGSEVALAMAAARALADDACPTRVVSMPCAERFDRQDDDYRERVLPSTLRARVAVESAQGDWWRKYVGLEGRVLGLSGFGESAPGKELFEHFGFNVANLRALVRETLD